MARLRARSAFLHHREETAVVHVLPPGGLCPDIGVAHLIELGDGRILVDFRRLPDPYPPAGWGYSYLDWFGAYNMANAVLAALYRRVIAECLG